MNWRLKTLLLYDFLKGKQLQRDIVDIRGYHECKTLLEKQHYQKNKLSRILQYAVVNSSFYKSYSVDSKINDFKVINKEIIKDNYKLILTRSIKGLKKSSTSGSTGTPFVIYQDKRKALRNTADFTYFYGVGGYEFGNRLYFLRAWENCKKNPIYLFLTNMIMQETKNLSDTNISKFLSTLKKDSSKKFLWAYASSLTAIVNSVGESNLSKEIRLAAIFSGSEALPDRTKKRLKRVFGCPVYSRYSNQEMGMIAQQVSPSDDLFTLNEASYFIEFLKMGSDEEARPGEPARIVITDLFNTAMPLIRYDTGDIGVYKIMDKIRYLERIEGRQTDFIYNTAGELISPHAISMSMWEFNEINQFQFIQESEKLYKIIINSSVPIDELKVKNNMKKQLGQDAHIVVHYVDEIPVLSSGKRRYIINRMK